MEKTMSKRDVIVRRRIWYLMTLLSLLGFSISLNLLWPPGGKYESTKSRFLRYGAVCATTFYAVTLLRQLFFTDPPSPSYKDFTTMRERVRQFFISQLALNVVIISPFIWYMLMKELVLSEFLFTISLFTGGIGLIQLSDNLRMETRHALLTLFLGWLFGLSGIYIYSSYDQHPQRSRFVIIFQVHAPLLIHFLLA